MSDNVARERVMLELKRAAAPFALYVLLVAALALLVVGRDRGFRKP